MPRRPWSLRLAALAVPAVLSAQDTTFIPGPQYAAGGAHRTWFGAHWRDAWLRPLSAPIVRVDTIAGGLVPTQVGGGQQTRSLRFAAPDGREFVFRSMAKDFTAQLPPSLRGTQIADIVADQLSAAHPLAPRLAAPILAALEIPHATPTLVVLADHVALDTFRTEFGGRAGWLEARPSDDAPVPGRPDLRGEVISTDDLLRELERRPATTLDTTAYLVARLADLLIGDWDRHEDQWRWVLPAGQTRWLPIPRDRDQAFSRFDGVLLGLARFSAPQLRVFGPAFGGIGGLVWNARRLDRRLLAGVPAQAYVAAAAHVQARVSDDVVDAVVATLPVDTPEQERTFLREALRARRAALPTVARAFHAHLAREVTLHLTDAAEVIAITRDAQGVTIDVRRDTLRATMRFPHEETRELRLLTQGGRDRIVLAGRGPTRLHLDPGGGSDSVTAPDGAGGVVIHAARGADALPSGATIDRRPYDPATFGDSLGHQRDWGGYPEVVPWFTVQPDVGLFLGGGVRRLDFGFRKHPYASAFLLRGGWAFGAGTSRIELVGDIPRRNSRTRLTLLARHSGIEVVRFHGFGNATTISADDAFYRVPMSIATLGAGITWRTGTPTTISVGALAKHVRTDLRPDRFISVARPYGTTQSVGHVGITGSVHHDSRDRAAWPTRGTMLGAVAAGYPAIWDLDAFGTLDLRAATWVTPRGGPTLALRAGSRLTTGRVPLHEAAVVGGAQTVRGLREGRFAGDASLWGSAELRAAVGAHRLVLPGDWGVMALADAGRVWRAGERSRRWHAGWGGGVWLSVMDRAGTLSAVVATGEDRTALYVRAGFLH